MTLLVGPFDPQKKLVLDMTYNVFGGTLNLTQLNCVPYRYLISGRKYVYFGQQSDDTVMEGSVTNVAFPPVSYQHQAPHPAPIRHHATVSAQPVLLQPLPNTEFIVSSSSVPVRVVFNNLAVA